MFIYIYGYVLDILFIEEYYTDIERQYKWTCHTQCGNLKYLF